MHDHNRRYATNVRNFYVYTIAQGLHFGLVTAIWVIFFQQQFALGLTAITLIDVVAWTVATLGEVPTGIVADSYSRKASLVIGAAIMGVSAFGWAFAPTVLLGVVAYGALVFGATFLSGAEDALLFESLKMTGQAGDYARLAGRMSATRLGAVVVGNLASGLLATINLRLPFVMAGICLLLMLGVALTFKEPKADETVPRAARVSYGQILRQAVAIVRARPALRAAIAYLTIVPLAAVIMQTVFLQPQAVALGVPLAGVGVVVMAAQFANLGGSATAHRVQQLLGEARVLQLAPFAIAASLVLLGSFQVLPALTFAAIISFVTAVIRPIAMNSIQQEVTDDIRATVLSLQSLIFAFVAAIIEPLLGYVGEHVSLPVAYYVLAAALIGVMLLLQWRGRSATG